MASQTSVRASSKTGFNTTRELYGRPELPPGYDWPTQIRKYCPFGLPRVLGFPERHEFGHVFCHRGLYDRAKRIPENSSYAIMNGIEKSLLLHEVDARMGDDANNTFLAHDEHASRVTAKNRKWSSINTEEILDTKLVTRRFNVVTNDFASSYQEIQEKVPLLEDLLVDCVDWDDGIPEAVQSYLLRNVEDGADKVDTLKSCFHDGKISDEKELESLRYWFQYYLPSGLDHDDGRCLQLDLRGKDFLKAILFFQTLGRDQNPKVLLKGYNFEFASCKDLEAALDFEISSRRTKFERVKGKFGRARKKFAWTGFPESPYIMMVFYSKPLIALALKAKGMVDPDKATLGDRLSLDFHHIRTIIMEQVSSFISVPGLNFIPEIAHSGLGLGYNIHTGVAINPWNGAAITNPEVLLESRVDRAMIEVSLELRRKHPKLYFSSCTRLCEVSTSKDEFVADIKTGRLKLKPSGEKGISTHLRSIHGGLFPQSHLVVADDPFGEIAARTWIDEYARLDRRQLLNLSYTEWLAQARPEVVAAVNKLNGAFLPNRFDGPLDDNSYTQEEGAVS